MEKGSPRIISHSGLGSLLLFSGIIACSEPIPAPSNPSGLFAVTSPSNRDSSSSSSSGTGSGTTTPVPSEALNLPLLLDPPAGAEGVYRDLTLRFAGPITQPERFSLEAAGERYRFKITGDPTTLTLAEPAPPWTGLVVYYDTLFPLYSFTSGADITGDPLRVVAITPSLQQPLPPEQGIELRFSHRIDPEVEIQLMVHCNGEPQAVRWFMRKEGARLRIEPLYAWAQPALCVLTFESFSLPPTGPLPFSIAPISFTTLPPQGRLRISEVVVDPQSDWSDESGIPFDPQPGSNAPGTNDEFVEIVNASSAVVDLRGYRVEMLDGSDEVLILGGTTTAQLRILPEGSALDSLPPCGVLVIGDPPGMMNNESLIRLVDPQNQVVDFLHLTGSSTLAGLPGVYYNPRGGGNSDSPEDEAVYPLWVTGPNAPLVQGRATPGSVRCP